MTDKMPDEIWLEHPSACDPQAGQMWCVDKDALCDDADFPPVKYVRADKLEEVQSRVKDLELLLCPEQLSGVATSMIEKAKRADEALRAKLDMCNKAFEGQCKVSDELRARVKELVRLAEFDAKTCDMLRAKINEYQLRLNHQGAKLEVAEKYKQMWEDNAIYEKYDALREAAKDVARSLRKYSIIQNGVENEAARALAKYKSVVGEKG